jgi:alpha-glucosidase (family GH31 glycosyl hydrolase)
VTIRIYTGASGSFELYEDDGISQEYLEGTYSLTKFSWDNKKKTLSIAPVQGSGANSSARTMVIELLPAGTSKTVQWNGKPVKVKM